MANHVKPTKEELKAQVEASLAAVEKQEKEGKVVVESEVKEEKEEVVVEEEKKNEVPEEKKEEKKEDELNEDEIVIDYKKKFVDSTREAQVLHSKNKKLAEAIDKTNEIAEPTDEEMAKEYSEWEAMDEISKKLAKKSVVAERKLDLIVNTHKESKDIEAWYDKVDGFVSDPKTFISQPQLEGREDEFKLFATKPSRRGADLEDLVSAFLFEVTKTAKPKNKGAMFETASAGPNKKSEVRSDKLSVEEARNLRVNDYEKYKQFLKAGKIDLETI